MGLFNSLFGPSEPTPQERRKAREDRRETRRIVGQRDTGEIADATASGAWSISIEPEAGTNGKVTGTAHNRRGHSWPGQRITETEAYETGETPKLTGGLW